MTKRSAAILSTIFFFIAPGTVVGIIPWWLCRWHLSPPLLGLPALRYLGGLLLVAGLAVLVDSFLQFVIRGSGTPAPVAPPKTLVISGFYRYVRNPMYVAFVSAIAGQGLLFGSRRVLIYAAGAWLTTHLFVCLYEEPHLRAQFGEQYDAFVRHVPRWIPRLTPWTGD
jgi:protein-S-isoprenylcysteine O-methyltransferase Ste14